MTRVPQLQVESPSTKALPKGESPRGRAGKPKEEGGEGGFATALAQALPERRQAEQPERALEPQSFRVEGEGSAAQDEQQSALEGVGGATKRGVAVRIAGLAAAPQIASAAPVAVEQELPAVTGMKPHHEAVAVTEALEERTAAEGALVEKFREAEIVEAEDAPRQEPAQSLEPLAETSELETAQARPAPKTVEESRTQERTHAAPATPPAAPVQTEQAPREPSTRPQQKEGPIVPGVEDAAEPKRPVETPVASKTAPPRAAGAPVIEFEVRREPSAQDVRRQPQTAVWAQALQSNPAQRSGAAEQQPQLATATPAAETMPQAKPAEMLEPAPPKDIQQGRLRPAEHAEGRRLQARTVVAAPQMDLGEDEGQAGRGGSAGAAEFRDEPPERKAQLNPQALSVSNIVANLSADPPSSAEKSKQATLQPMISPTPAAPPAHAPQTAAPAESVPLPDSRVQPLEAASQVAGSSPTSEPAIAAKLQYESGRTTLHVVLEDERLGRVALQLVERGGWIETAIRASDPRTAQTLSNGAAALFEALEQRGLTLAAGSGASAWDAREGQRRNNTQGDQESPRRRFRLRRSGGEFEGALARAEV